MTRRRRHALLVATVAALVLAAGPVGAVDSAPPPTPSGVTATRLLNSMVFTWDAVGASPPVTGYQLVITSGAPGDPPVYDIEAPATNRRVSWTALIPGRTYSFQVRAINTEGESAWSDAQEFTWVEQSVNLNAWLATSNTAEMRWSLAVPAPATYGIWVNDHLMRWLPAEVDGISLPVLPGRNEIRLSATNPEGDWAGPPEVALVVPESSMPLYPDVPTGVAFFTETFWMAQRGITFGYGDGTYRPGRPVTRGQMAAFLHRGNDVAVLGGYRPAPTPSFRDVPTAHVFYEEISWLADSGITTGFGDGTFRAGRPVTRGQMAAFLFRMARPEAYAPPAAPTFDDVPLTHPFYAEISWLVTRDISRGYGDGTFRPDRPINRGEMAALLFRLWFLG